MSKQSQGKTQQRKPAGPVTGVVRLCAIVAMFTAFLFSGVMPSPAGANLPPDPLTPGPYDTNTAPYYAGDLQITVPSSGYTASNQSCTTGPSTLVYGQSTRCPGNTFPQRLEGRVTWPEGDGPFTPLLFLHGRHNACKSSTGADMGSQNFVTGGCTYGFWESWDGYQYLAELLASHGYAVISPSAGAVVLYDTNTYNPIDAGAMARAEIIANSLDLFRLWNEEEGPDGIDENLIDKLDFSKIGVMGHSRGGEGVTQFLEYNRQRPAPGFRYNLQAVFSLAPIDRNKHFPQGTNFANLAPACDGDVSSITGVNAFERGKYANLAEPFAKVNYYVEGANHNFYNSKWANSDRTGSDPACGSTPSTRVRLDRPDQEKNGLATIATFLRAYMGEDELKPWTTGEFGLPESSCPVGTFKTEFCEDQTKISYIAPASERQDIIRPDSGVKPTTSTPRAPNSAGGVMVGEDLALMEWCNPDPYSQVVANPPVGQGTLVPIQICPGPNFGSATTQSYNRSWGPQLALAWDGPSKLTATLGGSARDASRFASLSFRAAVQFTDTTRNPGSALAAAAYNPRAAIKDFRIALVDRSGAESEVKLTDVHEGGLQNSLGAINSTTQPRHQSLNGFRIPLSLFAEEVNLKSLARVEFRFGGEEVSPTGAIQFADLAFQEPAPEEEPQNPNSEEPPAEPEPEQESDPVQAPTHMLATDRVLPKVDALVTGNPELALFNGTTDCAEFLKPVVRSGSAKRRGGRLVVSGRAKDIGCSGLKRIEVSVAKKARGKKCRFLSGSGRLGPAVRCGARSAIVASGTERWRLGVRLAGKLPRGRYRVTIRAIDAAGNISRGKVTSLRVR